MKNLFLIVFMFAVAGLGFSQTPSAVEILRRVDNNEIFNTIQYEGEIINERRGRQFVITFNAWARGNTHSFIEFTNREDRGTRYLRRDGRLMVYSPDNEGVMLISGHMLRDSMMGSAMSYEDTLDNAPLSRRYNPVLLGSETVTRPNGNRDVWVLELNAIDRTREYYARRKLWIDKENDDVLRYELFALSGALLKEYEMLEVQVIGNRRFPVKGEMRDIQGGINTTFVMRNVILDRPIADSVFSDRNLER
ncbi:MAG: outer membrane lipoprotein-sorting protein [Treponema sp.]|jgi:outer membrane lipoprotein-sorting protein|nr:outer membrane lipoprotein-sorting protein [Treponema sp.]